MRLNLGLSVAVYLQHPSSHQYVDEMQVTSSLTFHDLGQFAGAVGGYRGKAVALDEVLSGLYGRLLGPQVLCRDRLPHHHTVAEDITVL